MRLFPGVEDVLMDKIYSCSLFDGECRNNSILNNGSGFIMERGNAAQYSSSIPIVVISHALCMHSLVRSSIIISTVF
jgi:hypothetical protein